MFDYCKKKYNVKDRQITNMFATFVAPYVDIIFLQQSLIGDVHVTLDHELVLLYEGRLYSTEDGPVGH